MSEEIQTLTSRIAYANAWLRVREDTIRRRDGSAGLYGVVERTDFVIVVPFEDGVLTLVEQYRYPIGARLWEFPMGLCEHGPDRDPAISAAAELREETGIVARHLLDCGTIWQGPGYSNQRGHVFLASGLTQGPPAREVSEQGMLSRGFALGEVEAMIRQGVLQDAMSITAFAVVRLRGLI